MEFAIKLAGWVLDDLVFHKKMGIKHFILPEMHFNSPHHSLLELSVWGYEEG